MIAIDQPTLRLSLGRLIPYADSFGRWSGLSYAAPAKDWIDSEFIPWWESFLTSLDATTYCAGQECDWFGRTAAAMIELANAKRFNVPKDQKCAAGELWYMPDVGGRHEVTPVYCDDGQVRILDLTPDVTGMFRGWVTLSPSELKTCFTCSYLRV